MRKYFLLLAIFAGIIGAEEMSSSKLTKLLKRGQKVADSLCDKEKLQLIQAQDVNSTISLIDSQKPCSNLSSRNKRALSYYLIAKNKVPTTDARQHMSVPKGAKCPVCGMFVSKYPKWAALIEVEGKKHYFDGVKDMMKFYIFDADFPYNRSKINTMNVTDFYTLQAIEAKSAYFVIGSDVFGPMGDELIAFATKDAAVNFMNDHKGKKIVLFGDITPKLVMGLDGIEYND